MDFVSLASPVGKANVALAYSHSSPPDVSLVGVWSGLKRAGSHLLELLDSQLAWLCGEEDEPCGAVLEKRQEQGLSVKAAAASYEDAAYQHLLMAACHSEILPICTTPTCNGLK